MRKANDSLEYIWQAIKAIEAQGILPLANVRDGEIIGIYTSFPDDAYKFSGSNPSYVKWSNLVKDKSCRNEVAEFLKATGRVMKYQELN